MPSASMIGVGIFTTSGYAIEAIGSSHMVMMAWVLGAIYAFVGVWIYSTAASRVKTSGGDYAIVSSNLYALRVSLAFVGFATIAFLAIQRRRTV